MELHSSSSEKHKMRSEVSESEGRVQKWSYQPCQTMNGTGTTFSLVFCQHRGCFAVDASPGQAHKHQQTLVGRSGPVEAAPLLQMLKHKREPAAPSLSFRGSSRSKAVPGTGERECSQSTHQAPSGEVGSTQPRTLCPWHGALSCARVQHAPRGSLDQQLLVHLPSIQTHFLSLVHRDYSNSNQNREEKAPQNARGTKLYKG